MFCIITPIFDDALRAANLLIKDLDRQTYKDFVHVLVSNGHSHKIQANLAKRERVQYIELPYENTIEIFDLVSNLGRRRNYCIKNIKADRYFFFDADLLLTDDTFLEKVNAVHDKADVIISKVIISKNENHTYILPTGTRKGQIDIANYSFSKAIAEKYDYPTLCDADIANDFRFYDKIRNESHHYLDVVYAIKDGRKVYETVSMRFVNDNYAKKEMKSVLFQANLPDCDRNYYTLDVLRKIVRIVRLPIPLYHKGNKIREIRKWFIEGNQLIAEGVSHFEDFSFMGKKIGYMDEDEFFHVQDVETVEGVSCARIY